MHRDFVPLALTNVEVMLLIQTCSYNYCKNHLKVPKVAVDSPIVALCSLMNCFVFLQLNY